MFAKYISPSYKIHRCVVIILGRTGNFVIFLYIVMRYCISLISSSQMYDEVKLQLRQMKQVPMQQHIMPTGISYLFLCVSQPERSVVSELSGPSLNRRGGQVRGTLSSSDLLFFLSLKTHRSSFIHGSAPRETGSVCITDSIHHLKPKDLSHL